MNLFLSPHNDDETLFGAYTLLSQHPHVIVVLRSFVEEAWNPPIYHHVRESETACAMKVLDCTWEQWTFADDMPDWDQIRSLLETYTPEHVWAPMPEPGGHMHHNIIGEIASELFPESSITYYTTYNSFTDRSVGVPVAAEPGWSEIKQRALACYPSQANDPHTACHFRRPLDEYYAL